MYPSYSYFPSGSLVHYPYQEPIRHDDNFIYLYDNHLATRQMSLGGDAAAPIADPYGSVVDSSPYQVVEPTFGSELFTQDVIPLDAGHGYDPYNYSLSAELPEEKPSFLSLDNFESNLPADLSFHSGPGGQIAYASDSLSESVSFCPELYTPEVMPQEIEIDSGVESTTSSSNLIAREEFGNEKSRRKKKAPVEYQLLDINTPGEEKREFIKYVGKGSYKCQICNIYSKNNKDYIQDHINIKHYGIKKNYECMKCGITFAWRSGAFKHLKKYHHIEGKNTINYFRAISKRHMYISQRKRK